MSMVLHQQWCISPVGNIGITKYPSLSRTDIVNRAPLRSAPPTYVKGGCQKWKENITII